MKSLYAQLMVAATLLLGSSAAFAQLGNGGAAYADKDGGGNVAGPLLNKFVAGSQSVLAGEAGMLGALGLKADADKASAQLKALEQEVTRGVLEAMIKGQADSNAALVQKLGAAVTLDADAKMQFGSGVTELARGMTQYAGLTQDAATVKKTMRGGASGTSPALYAAKALSSSLDELKRTLKMALDVAKANNIALGPEAAEAAAL
ncbi:MAG: hypothetical protein V4463_05420 [Pseudomonadota bacterium]